MPQNAKGVAILRVLKGGFVVSGRAGEGKVVARLPGGGWSGPSAIANAGPCPKSRRDFLQPLRGEDIFPEREPELSPGRRRCALARPSLASGIAESPGRDVGLAESGF